MALYTSISPWLYPERHKQTLTVITVYRCSNILVINTDTDLISTEKGSQNGTVACFILFVIYYRLYFHQVLQLSSPLHMPARRSHFGSMKPF